MSRIRERKKYSDYSDFTTRYSYWEMGSWAPVQFYDQGVKPAVSEIEWMSDSTNGRNRPRSSYLHHWKIRRTLCNPHWEVNGSANLYRRSPYETMQRVPLGLPANASMDSGFGYGFPTELLNEAVKDGSLMQQAQGLPFIAELRQCIEMVRNPLSFLKHFSVPRRHRNKTLGELANLKRSAGDGILLYKYGWKPLISDLYAFANIVSGLSGNYASYQQLAGRGFVGRVNKQISARASSEPVLPNQYDEALFSRIKTKATLKGSLWYKIGPSPQVMTKCQYLMSSLGLTPGDIVSTIWELVPYSFVVDWFIPVGDTLQRITHTPANFAVQDTCYVLSYDSQRETYRHCDLRVGTPWAPSPASRVELIANDVSRQTFRGGESVLPQSELPWYESIRFVAALALIEQKLRLPVSK